MKEKLDSGKNPVTWGQGSVLGGERGNGGQTTGSRSLVTHGIMTGGITGSVEGLGRRSNNDHVPK